MGHLAIILAFCFGSLFGTSPEADLLFAGDAMMHQAQIDAAAEWRKGEVMTMPIVSLR